MNELVKLLSKNLNLPEDVARQAVELILNQLKQNLPAPIASQIDGLIKGKVSLSDLAKLPQGGGGLLGKLTGLLGKK